MWPDKSFELLKNGRRDMKSIKRKNEGAKRTEEYCLLGCDVMQSGRSL
jgi:hypothetical protein